jgi:hypothetical protein
MAGMENKEGLPNKVANLLLTPVFFYAFFYARRQNLVWLEWLLGLIAVAALSRILIIHFKKPLG